ncbi:hypothetical protein C8Q76DRAFT_217617 [Earliella scabrosa]|nr:hypothetical protein C8Q76DRAFT_217617 [Earliella scabrosa]
MRTSVRRTSARRRSGALPVCGSTAIVDACLDIVVNSLLGWPLHPPSSGKGLVQAMRPPRLVFRTCAEPDGLQMAVPSTLFKPRIPTTSRISTHPIYFLRLQSSRITSNTSRRPESVLFLSPRASAPSRYDFHVVLLARENICIQPTVATSASLANARYHSDSAHAHVVESTSATPHRTSSRPRAGSSEHIHCCLLCKRTRLLVVNHLVYWC